MMSEEDGSQEEEGQMFVMCYDVTVPGKSDTHTFKTLHAKVG